MFGLIKLLGKLFLAIIFLVLIIFSLSFLVSITRDIVPFDVGAMVPTMPVVGGYSYVAFAMLFVVCGTLAFWFLRLLWRK